ncbi:MAG: hypothetical protein WAW37_07040 [Syntrophobacteraceae bacterium]
MKRLALAFVLLFFVSACGPVNKPLRPTAAEMTNVKRLAICIPAEGSFTIINERAKATATPAVLFGLTGVIVASAYNQHGDAETAKTISTNLEGISCRAVFIDSLKNSLSESGRFTETTYFEGESKLEEMSKYDAVVTFQIESWGLRLVERSQGDLMKPYLEVRSRMLSPSGKTLWDERDVVAGNGRNTLSSYQHERGLLKKDMEEAISEAGRRMALSLIYQ